MRMAPRIHIIGTMATSTHGRPMTAFRRTTYWGGAVELHEVLELARAGKIRAHVQHFGLDEAPTVYERLRRGEMDGRAVVCPQG